jgi:serine protease inhibitor
VGDQTDRLIPELVPEWMVTSQSVLVLLNALYLAADRERAFGTSVSI